MWFSPSNRSAERRRPTGRLRWFRLAAALFALPGLGAQAVDPDAVPFTLYVNNRPAGQLNVNPGGQQPRVVRDSLLKALGDRLSYEARSRVESLPPIFDPDELAADGFGFEFDDSLLEAHLSLEPRLFAPNLLRLQSGLEFMDARAEGPAAVSGFINGRLRSEAWYQGYSAGGGALTLPFQLGFEPTLNIAGWVSEADVRLERTQAVAIELDQARLIRDSENGSWRFNLGSLLLPVTGYQSYMQLAGAGFTFDPTRTAVARGRKSPLGDIFLEHPGKVDVYLNDRLIKSMRVDAGRLRLLDVPFTTGLNELRVELTEEGGMPVSRSISAPFDARMLDEGEASWHASLGVPQWKAELPILSAYVLYGLIPAVSLGVNTQAGMDRQIGGLETVLATPFGNFMTDLGLSTRSGTAFDYGGRLQYRLALPGRKDAPGLGLAVEYLGSDFLGPAALQAANDYSWRFSAGYGQGLPAGVGLNLGAGYRVGRNGAADAASASLSLFRPLGAGLTISFNLTLDAPIGGLPLVRGVFGLVSTPLDSPHSLSLSNSVNGDGASLEYQYRSGKPGQPEYSVGADGLPVNPHAPMSGRLGLRLDDRLAELAVNNTAWTYPGESVNFVNRLSLQAAASVLYADGQWAFSRPVSDAFALIRPGPELAALRVDANHGREGLSTAAQNGWPGVLPRLVSYAPTSLELEAPEAPPGLEISNFRRILQPTYRSGILIEVRASSLQQAMGRLLFIDGRPVALQAGEMLNLDRPGSAPVQFFTDEDGRFQAHSLEPGRHALRLFVHEQARTEFEVPLSAQGQIDLGSLTLPVLQKEK